MKRKAKVKTKTKRNPKTRLTWSSVRRILTDAVCYIVGCLCYAVAVNVFTAPNHIAPGGLTGLATVLNFLDNRVPIGTTIFLMNIPLLIACWFKGGRSFTVRTLICTFLSSFAIDLLEPFVPPYVKEDSLLVPIFGGVIMGVGLGLLFLRGASTGGSEIVARLFERRFPHIPIGRIMLMLDAIVVALAAFVFNDITSAMYAIILIFVSSSLIDSIVYGGNAGKMALIISNKDGEVADAILHQLGRGVTKLDSHGAYSGESRHVLMCAVRRSQLYAVRQLVASIDPEAFIIVTSTDEVFGRGFKPHQDNS